MSDKPFEATFETDFDTPFAQFESAEPAAAAQFGGGEPEAVKHEPVQLLRMV